MFVCCTTFSQGQGCTSTGTSACPGQCYYRRTEGTCLKPVSSTRSLRTRIQGLVAALVHVALENPARPYPQCQVPYLLAPWHARKGTRHAPLPPPSSAPLKVGSGAPTTGGDVLSASLPAENTASTAHLPLGRVLCHHDHKAVRR